MGGPFMVEIVFCRVTRRGRKKKVCPIIDMIMMVSIRWMRTPQTKNACDIIVVMIVFYRLVWTSWLGRTAGTTDQWEEDSSPQILWRYNMHIDNSEKEEEEGERAHDDRDDGDDDENDENICDQWSQIAQITLDLSDTGPVFSALDDMMMKMMEDDERVGNLVIIDHLRFPNQITNHHLHGHHCHHGHARQESEGGRRTTPRPRWPWRSCSSQASLASRPCSEQRTPRQSKSNYNSIFNLKGIVYKLHIYALSESGLYSFDKSIQSQETKASS